MSTSTSATIATVAVVAFVHDARHAAPGRDAGPRGSGFRRRTRLPIRRLGGRADDVFQPRIAEVPQPVRDRVGLDVRGDLVEEALVRERVLQSLTATAADR